jgi:hypothetical protein
LGKFDFFSLGSQPLKRTMEGKSRQDPVVVSSTGLHNSVGSPLTSQIINKLPFTAMISPTR